MNTMTNISFLRIEWSRFNTAPLIVLVFVLLIECPMGRAQRVPKPSTVGQSEEISGVKFTVPNDFRLEQSSKSNVAFMRHEKDDFALFVAVPKNKQVDDEYLTSISNEVASHLVPHEQGYVWKISRGSDAKTDTRRGFIITTKGFNDRVYVQTDFMVVKAQQQTVVLGSIFSSGDRGAKHLFDVEGHEYSFSGWKAIFQLMASVTGERYQ